MEGGWNIQDRNFKPRLIINTYICKMEDNNVMTFRLYTTLFIVEVVVYNSQLLFVNESLKLFNTEKQTNIFMMFNQ